MREVPSSLITDPDYDGRLSSRRRDAEETAEEMFFRTRRRLEGANHDEGVAVNIVLQRAKELIEQTTERINETQAGDLRVLLKRLIEEYESQQNQIINLTQRLDACKKMLGLDG